MPFDIYVHVTNHMRWQPEIIPSGEKHPGGCLQSIVLTITPCFFVFAMIYPFDFTFLTLCLTLQAIRNSPDTPNTQPRHVFSIYVFTSRCKQSIVIFDSILSKYKPYSLSEISGSLVSKCFTMFTIFSFSFFSRALITEKGGNLWGFCHYQKSLYHASNLVINLMLILIIATLDDFFFSKCNCYYLLL